VLQEEPDVVLLALAYTSQELALLAAAGGQVPALLNVLEGVPDVTPWVIACRAAVLGEYTKAAEAYAAIGSLPDEAHARLQAGGRLLAAGQGARSARELEKSLAFWRSVGARGRIEECESLLGRARSA
jgi:hypothetical protein